ncbi:MAG: extracellular solute-binding protein [Clostridiales bacterium]|nr:extracellular solute-binding protein [Clostridiales bacterium]
MRKMKRIIAFVLATMMLSAVCLTASSCKKKGAKKKTVLETDPFYTTKRITLDPEFVAEENFYVMPIGMWMCNDRFVTLYDVERRIENDDIYYYDAMCIFDMEGNLLQVVDLYEVMYSVRGTGAVALAFCEGEQGLRFYFENFATTQPFDGTIQSEDQLMDMTIKEFVYYCEFDPDSGELIVPPQEVRTDPDDVYFFSMHFIEGYEVGSITSFKEDKKGWLAIHVSKDGEPLYNVEFDDVFGPGVVKHVEGLYGAGDGTVLIDCIGNGPLLAKLDLATGRMTKVTEAKPISSNQKISSTREGKGYLTKATGIYEFDPTSENEVCVLNYDHCNINRYESQSADVLSIDENRVIIGCSPVMEGEFLLPDPVVVYVLEKAEKNPNAGKTVLTVATLSDSVSYFEGEALKTFNEQNPDYFVQLVLYEQNAYQKTGDVTDDIDTSDRQMYDAMAMVSGSLSMDIRSGDGPDVVLGAAQSLDLLDSQYLMDLTPYLEGQSYDASKYYSQIIDASKIDGKTYFIPTSFSICGMIMDGSKVDENQVGFTYEQYISFVENQRNGSEPVTEYISRMHFLNLCFERNYTQWVKDKKMHIDQEDFREMVAFFKEKIPVGVSVEPLDIRDLFDPEAEEVLKDIVFVENISSTQDLGHANYYFDDNLRIFGLPSKDGTGPSANIMNSFSITEGSAVKDGAYALLDILLSEEIQKKAIDTIPINRAAVSYRLERQTENNRNGYSCLFYPYSINTMAIARNLSVYPPEAKFPEILLQTLESVDTIFLSDNAIMMIVDEEIPAYLLGQKDLDSVIATINNRSQNVFNER